MLRTFFFCCSPSGLLRVALHLLCLQWCSVRFQLETDIRVLLFRLVWKRRWQRARQTIYSRFGEFGWRFSLLFFLSAYRHRRRRLVPVNVLFHCYHLSAEFRRLGRIHSLLPLVRLVTHFSPAIRTLVETCITANGEHGECQNVVGNCHIATSTATAIHNLFNINDFSLEHTALLPLPLPRCVRFKWLNFRDSRCVRWCRYTARICVADDHPKNPFSMAQATTTLFCY